MDGKTLGRMLAAAAPIARDSHKQGVRNCVAIRNGAFEVTNLEQMVRIVDGDIFEAETSGVAALKPIVEFCRMHPGKISIGQSGDKLQMLNGSGSIAVPLESLDNWPEFESGSPIHCGYTDNLADNLARVVYCMSDDPYRPAINGVQLTAANPNGKIEYQATDGRRLAVATGTGTLHFPIFLHANLAEAALKLHKIQPLTHLIATDKAFGLRGDNWVVMSRQTDAQFPNFVQVLARDNADPVWRFQCDVKPLCEAVKAAAVAVPAGANRCIKLDVELGGLRLSGKTPELGESSAAVETYCCAIADGAAKVLGVDADYLSDALRACDSRNPVDLMQYGNELGLVRVSQASALHGIMPMRL